MSTSPDDLVALLSRWLAGHVGDEELRRALDSVEGLSPGQAEAVDELRNELDRAGPNGRGDLQMMVREALEALALGG